MRKLITLKPLEPYFFGGERTFGGYGENNSKLAGSYFIRSLNTPAQTALFGVLRYLGIQEKQADYALKEKDKDNIGAASFNLLQVPSDGKIGRILRISPLYLMDNDGDMYVPAPFDHNTDKKNNHIYAPYLDYSSARQTVGCGDSVQERIFPKAFKAKNGLCFAWMRLKDGAIRAEDDIFRPVARPHVDKQKVIQSGAEQEKGFVKREYKIMPDFCFAFIAEVEKGFTCRAQEPQVVYMGQKKSAFAATIGDFSDDEMKETDATLKTLLRLRHDGFPAAKPLADHVFVYLQSDAYLGEKTIDQLYNCCSFAMALPKEHRIFTTNYEAGGNHLRRYRKGEQLLRFLRAGSVFWARKESIVQFRAEIDNAHRQMAGFNHIVTGEE
ncbi:MAG: type III-B CRISPR module-associated protein Cmr3 [Desulfobulbaceae bacterium]|jgi:CRISPR-associated protein Cmr3|nr:type III-B CRISPR module-associated protein Cmr3 [Desulfobulbaceae bacterium]